MAWRNSPCSIYGDRHVCLAAFRLHCFYQPVFNSPTHRPPLHRVWLRFSICACISEMYNATNVSLQFHSAFTFNSTPAAGNTAENCVHCDSRLTFLGRPTSHPRYWSMSRLLGACFSGAPVLPTSHCVFTTDSAITATKKLTSRLQEAASAACADKTACCPANRERPGSCSLRSLLESHNLDLEAKKQCWEA